MKKKENMCTRMSSALLRQKAEGDKDLRRHRQAYWTLFGNLSRQIHMAATTQAPIWATSASVFQHCSVFQTDHYMWSTVCVIVFIHPHMPNKQSCGAGNVLENHQMLCCGATVFVTGVWFVEHLFSRLAAVFLSLHESFLVRAVTLPTLSCDYSPLAMFLESLF